jgi:hypothetical protein
LDAGSKECHRCDMREDISAGVIRGHRSHTKGRSSLQKMRKAFGGCFLWRLGGVVFGFS